MVTHTISPKGWVVIPAELRRKYHLTPGTQVIIVDYGGVLSIVPTRSDPVKTGRGLLKDIPGLLGEVLAEHTKERNRDERRRPLCSTRR